MGSPSTCLTATSAKPASAPTDLTDTEWHVIAPLLAASDKPGRPWQDSWRIILKAVFSVLQTGCYWWFLPHDGPNWTTASH
jgi:transposase